MLGHSERGLPPRDTPPGDRDTERDTERWLRLQGLPSFVKPHARASRLVARTAPFLVFAVALDVLTSVVLDIDIELDEDASSATGILFLVIVPLLVLAVPAVPIALGLLSARLMRRHPTLKTPIGLCALALYLVADPLFFAVLGDGRVLENALENLGVAVGAVALTFLGIGSLLSWAARAAFGQLSALGQLATRALPLLMLVVVFAYFARALWEVTSSMDVPRLIGVALFFVVLGLLFVIPIMRREIRGLDERIDSAERDSLLGQTPLAGLLGRPAAAGPPLNGLERLNLATVMVLAQGFQVMIFSALVCVFLIALGLLAFSPSVLALWLGGNSSMVEVLGIQLPISTGLVKTAVFLSCVSSLNFLVTVTSGTAYRSAFYDPLLREARIAITVRAAYLAGPTVAAAGPADGTADAEGRG